MAKAFSELHAENVALSDETRGAKWFNALIKARVEIERNDTIIFEVGILRFTSAQSGKKRIVTKTGCHSSTCDCKDAISYHKAIYLLLERYFELKKREVVYA